MARSTPVHSGYSIINGSGTGPNGYLIDVWIEWKVLDQDIAENRSRVSAYFYAALHTGTSSTWGGSGCYSAFSVNGVSGTNLKSNGSFDFRTTTPNLLGSFDGWITHNSDGTKSIGMSGSFTTSSDWITGGSASGTVTLPTIPRATTPEIPTMTLGESGTIDLSSRASSSFTHTLRYNINGTTGTIVIKTSVTSYNWTPPLSLASALPNDTYKTSALYCDTYSGSTLVGTKTVWFILQIPASVVPSISDVDFAQTSTNATINGWGLYVKGYSKVDIDVTAVGIYGSTIQSYYFAVKKGSTTLFSTTQAGAGWVSGILASSGSDFTVYVKVTDSRGRQATYTSGAFTVYDYSAPSVSLIDVFRCLGTGVKDLVNGTYISAKCTFSYSSVNGNNTITKKIEYRKVGDASWTMGQDNPANDTAYVFGGGLIGVPYSYEVRFTVDDAVTSAVLFTVLVRPGLTAIHIRPGGAGVGIGGAADADEFQVYMASVFKNSLKVGANDVWHAGNLSVEIGSCTLTLYGSTTAGTPTYNTRSGYYVRIGVFVFVWYWINCSGLGGATGEIRISGLPFTSMNVANLAYSSLFAGSSGGITLSTARGLSAYVAANATYFGFRLITESSGTLGWTALTNSHIGGSGVTLSGMLTYRAA
ncbi:MAG: DUF859 family phage minor structural protein [Bacillota bacterium]